MASLLLLLSGGLIFSDNGVSETEKNVLSILIVIAFVFLIVLALATVLKDVVCIKTVKKSKVVVRSDLIDDNNVTATTSATEIAITAVPLVEVNDTPTPALKDEEN
jgi:hypothetical protein